MGAPWAAGSVGMVTLSAVRSAGAAEAAREDELFSRREATLSLVPVGVEVRLGVGGLVDEEAVVTGLLLARASWARRSEGTLRWMRPGLPELR